MSDHDLGTQIYITTYSIFQCGNGFMEIILQNKESHKSRQVLKTLVSIRESGTLRWGDFSIGSRGNGCTGELELAHDKVTSLQPVTIPVPLQD